MGQRSAAKVRCLGQIIAYFSSKLTHITQCNDHQGVPNEYKQKKEGGGDRCIIELFSRAQRTLTSSASTRSTTFDQIFYSFSYNLANVCREGDSWYWLCIAKQKTERPNQKSRNGDTLGPVELIVWPLLEESIIIFGMSKSSGFKKYSICWVFQALSVSLSLSLSFSLSLSLYLCPLIIFE